MLNDQPDMAEEDFKDLVRIFPQNKLPNVGQAPYIKALIGDKETEYDLDEVIMYVSAILMSSFKADIELNLLTLLVTFVKSGNCSDEYVQRKRLSHKKFSPRESSFGVTLTTSIITNMWSFIEFYFKHQMVSPDELQTNLGTLIESLEIENVAIAPLIRQVVYRNLTGIKAICDSISEFPDFPWGALAKKHAKIGAEIHMFTKYIELIQHDKLIGYKITGMATEYPNLAFLCVQMQIVVNGKRSLLNYKGIGGVDTQVANKQYLQSLISEYQKDMISGIGSYSTLKESDVDLSQSLRDALTGFLTNVEDDDEDDEEGPKGHSSGPSPPPNPPRGNDPPKNPKRPRSPIPDASTSKRSRAQDSPLYDPKSPSMFEESKIEGILRSYEGNLDMEDAEYIGSYFRQNSISEEMRALICPSSIQIPEGSRPVEMPFKNATSEMFVKAIKIDDVRCPLANPTFLTILIRLRDAYKSPGLTQDEEDFMATTMSKTIWTRFLADKESSAIIEGIVLNLPLGLVYNLPCEEPYEGEGEDMDI